MNEKKKLIIIGAGHRGNAYTRLAMESDKFEVVAIAEPIKKRREFVAKRHNIPADRQFESWEPLLALGKIADAAIIATMDRDHLAPTIAALDTGYDLLLEKPVAPPRGLPQNRRARTEAQQTRPYLPRSSLHAILPRS